MATNAPAIEPLDGSRHARAIRLIVAGSPNYRRQIVNSLAFDAVALVDLAETEPALFDRIEREEFDCLIADQTFVQIALETTRDDDAGKERCVGPSERQANRRVEHRERVLRRGPSIGVEFAAEAEEQHGDKTA